MINIMKRYLIEKKNDLFISKKIKDKKKRNPRF